MNQIPYAIGCMLYIYPVKIGAYCIFIYETPIPPFEQRAGSLATYTPRCGYNNEVYPV